MPAILLALLISISVPPASALQQASLLYDQNGNRVQDSRFSYEYDDFNQLARVRSTATGQVVESYAYDESGQRIWKQEAQGNRTTFYPDPVLVAEMNSTGTVDTVYYRDPGQLLLAEEAGGTNAISYHHPDHLGSTTLVTGQAGQAVAETSYEPFGLAFSGGSGRFLFTGKELDAGTGLLYFGARFQDPALGQFLQPDPLVQDIHQPQGLNRYAYVQNNPYRYTDPDGRAIQPLAGVAGAAAGGAVGFLGYAFNHQGLFDWGAAEQAVAVGAIGGGIFGLTFGMSAVTTTVGGIAAAQAAHAARNVQEGKDVTDGLFKPQSVIADVLSILLEQTPSVDAPAGPGKQAEQRQDAAQPVERSFSPGTEGAAPAKTGTAAVKPAGVLQPQKNAPANIGSPKYAQANPPKKQPGQKPAPVQTIGKKPVKP